MAKFKMNVQLKPSTAPSEIIGGDFQQEYVDLNHVKSWMCELLGGSVDVLRFTGEDWINADQLAGRMAWFISQPTMELAEQLEDLRRGVFMGGENEADDGRF